MKLERPIIFLDIESTGVDPVKDRIIELGVVVLYPDGRKTMWCQRFNPGIPIPAEATAVHGINDEDVQDLPAFAGYARKLFYSLKDRDLAGYNLWRLDLPILDEELRRCGFKLDLTGVQVIDCFGLFAKKEPRKLEDFVKRYCDRTHEGAHGALADAAGTADGFLGMMVCYPDLAGMNLEEMAKFSRISEGELVDLAGKLYRDTDGDLCYAFGQHKGGKVRDHPDYAEWMLRKDFPGSTREALEAELEKMFGPAESGDGRWGLVPSEGQG